MAKTVKINLVKALASGAINLFQLKAEKNFILALSFAKAAATETYVCPIIEKKIYIEETGEVAENIIEPLVQEVLQSKIYAQLKGVKVYFRDAPRFEKQIKSFVSTKGACKAATIEADLEKKGYTFDTAVVLTTKVKRDYSELLEKDRFAKEIFEENHAELAKVGAMFEGLNLETKRAYKSVALGDNVGLIFEGPTGTGKSWAGRIIADEMKAPYLTLQIDHGTCVETLVGSFMPKTEEVVSKDTLDKIVETLRDESLSIEEAYVKASAFIKTAGEKAKWEFIPGPLLKAFSEGWIIILEEVNFGDPGVLAKLNEFTDKTLRVTINGIPYKRHPNFVVFMTMNPGYAGTDALNVALKGRFAKVNVPALTKEQFAARMVNYSKGCGHALSAEFFSKLYDFAGKIEALGNDPQYHENVKFSVRNAQRLCDNILSEPCSLEEFAADVAIQYINDLTTDNDNSEFVEKLKTDSNIVNDINAMYALYDFADAPVAETTANLSDFFVETDSGDSDAEDGELLSDKDLDDLMGGI